MRKYTTGYTIDISLKTCQLDKRGFRFKAGSSSKFCILLWWIHNLPSTYSVKVERRLKLSSDGDGQWHEETMKNSA